MPATARERIAELLGAAGNGTFSAELKSPTGALELEVAGVGPVKLPLRAPVTRKLIAQAHPARFGRGEETLSDTDVRDTWELSPAQFTLGGTGWQALLETSLEYFRTQLGLPARARLRAEPHALLLYGTGQFFLPHQDSEKDDSMIGTLAVSLPSAHTGGELIVEHVGEVRTYRGSRQELTLTAFYADCRHEVKPVRSGYRATLTFNLLATLPEADGADTQAAEAARCLREHFTTPVTERWSHRTSDPPNRLVFLLDHEYTQRGLAWTRLKGADAERAAVLRAAAEQADSEAVLALAEVKETWDAWPEDDDPWDRWNDRYDEDEDEDEDEEGYGRASGGDQGTYQLNDLIDDEITLGWWTRPDGSGGEKISLPLTGHEVCTATPNRELTPYDSQYEGYMGNYGNTLDRWYRRAAVVVWPKEKAFAARAEAASSGALNELRDHIDAGELTRARAAAQSLEPFWRTADGSPELLAVALPVAFGLDAAHTAAMLLAPFRAEMLGPEHAPDLAAVADRYGPDWTRKLIGHWLGPADHVHFAAADRGEWTARLPALVRALTAADAAWTAEVLGTELWRRLGPDLKSAARATRAMRRRLLPLHAGQLPELLEEASERLRTTVAEDLAAMDENVLEALVPLLRSAAGPASLPRWLEPVARDCARRLEAIAVREPRDPDDWSIAYDDGCGCDLCGTLHAFLRSRSERSMEWPLRQELRRHVHSRIDSADLPLTHATRRQGRPYALVLTKTHALFDEPVKARKKAVTDRRWLSARGI